MKRVLFCLALLGLYSCTTEPTVEQSADEPITKAQIIAENWECGDVLTKTSFSISSGVPVFSWAETDTIGIFPEVGSQVAFAISSKQDDSEATFVSEEWGLKSGQSYYAYYPIKWDLRQTKANIMLDYHKHNLYDSANLASYDYMYSSEVSQDGNAIGFKFKHLSTLLMFDLAIPDDGTFDYMDIVSSRDFMYEASLNLTDRTISEIQGAPYIGLSLNELTSTSNRIRVNLMASPIDLSGSDVVITLTRNDGKTYSAKFKGKNYESGKYYSINEELVPIEEVGPVLFPVDLGLSVKWSSMNLGAESFLDEGIKYAWGETEHKSSFSKSNYTFKDKGSFTDDSLSGTLPLKYDAANVNLGGTWRMPTEAEVTELFTGCKTECLDLNGVAAIKFTGPNGNSIIIPCRNSYYFLWTSTMEEDYPLALFLFGVDGYCEMDMYPQDGYQGYCIRPVCD